jgi:hypothetical protein
MVLETVGSTPDVVADRLRVEPWTATPDENDEVTQVVIEASMTAIPDARRRKFAMVTPGAVLAAAAAPLRGIDLGA